MVVMNGDREGIGELEVREESAFFLILSFNSDFLSSSV